MKKQLAWIFGGAAIVGLGLAGSLSACSSDDSNTNDSGAKDSTSPTDTGTNKDTGSNDTGTGGDTGPSDAGTGCEVSVPQGAPYTTDAGPFCPFQGDGSTFAACANGDHCCVTSALNSCQAGACVFAADASTNADFQCNETNDCAQGSVCCENVGAKVEGPDPGCVYEFVGTQKGTSCVVGTACPSGQGQICGAATDCNVGNVTGNTCYPLDTKAMWLGVCHTADGGLL